MLSSLFSSYEDDFVDTKRKLDVDIGKLQKTITDQRHSYNSGGANDDASNNNNNNNNNFISGNTRYQPPPSTGPCSRNSQLLLILQSIAHLKELLTSMSYEANDLPVQRGAREQAKSKVNSYRSEISSFEQTIATLKTDIVSADRADLLAFGVRADDDVEMHYKNNNNNKSTWRNNASHSIAPVDAATQAHRLTSLQTTEKLQGGTATLHRAERYLSSTNELGHDTFSTLRQQGDVIHQIHMASGSVDDELSQARRVLNRMQRTAIKHKLYLLGIIIALFALIIIMFYLKFKK